LKFNFHSICSAICPKFQLSCNVRELSRPVRPDPAYPLHVTIRGTGFLPAANVVRFGPVTLPAVSSPDGSRIMFYVPKEMPSRGEVPPAGLTPGDYPVTVINSAGTSNALSFRLTHGP
jgi:hypothetical protein